MVGLIVSNIASPLAVRTFYSDLIPHAPGKSRDRNRFGCALTANRTLVLVLQGLSDACVAENMRALCNHGNIHGNVETYDSDKLMLHTVGSI